MKEVAFSLARKGTTFREKVLQKAFMPVNIKKPPDLLLKKKGWGQFFNLRPTGKNRTLSPVGIRGPQG